MSRWQRRTGRSSARRVVLALGMPVAALSALALILSGQASAGSKPAADRAGLLFESTFDDGKADQWAVGQACCPHSLTMVKSPSRAGGMAARFEMRRSDPTEDRGTYGGRKADLRADGHELGREIWYGFSMYLPESYADSTGAIVLLQLHAGSAGRANKDAAGGGRPWAALSTENGELIFGVSADKERGPRSSIAKVDDVTGEWVDYLVRTKWDPRSPDDEIDVSMRRAGEADYELVWQRRGASGYDTEVDTGPPARIGLYLPRRVHKPEVYADSTVAYFDEYREGTDQAAVEIPAGGGTSGEPSTGPRGTPSKGRRGDDRRTTE